MNKIGLLVISMLLIFSLTVVKTYAWSWSDAGYGLYQNAYNLTVHNWTYAQTIGTTTFKQTGSQYLLVNLSFIGNPQQVNIIGYTNGGIPAGQVAYWVVGTQANSLTLLVNNVTQTNRRWSTATVFYNPAASVCPPPALPNCTRVGTWSYYHFKDISVRMINFSSQAESHAYVYTKPDITPSYNPGTIARFNYSILAPVGTGLVVFANHTLVSQHFNISYFPDLEHGIQITNTLNSRYLLISQTSPFTPFLSATILSNSPLESQNANYVFNGIGTVPFDNIGFEMYMSPNANQIITEGMTANESSTFSAPLGKMYNSSTSNTLALFGNGQSFDFGLNSSTGHPTSFLIIPAFTRNVVISNVISNNNVMNGTNGTFIYKTYVNNINWTFGYLTHAMPTSGYGTAPSNVINFTVRFTAGQVGYLKFTVVHDVAKFGAYCQSMFFQGYNPATQLQTGAIPYAVLNCGTPTGGTATILLSNKTVTGFTYNAFYLYSGSFTYLGNSNSVLFNTWQFAQKTGEFNVIDTGNNPYLVTLNGTLAPNSLITYGNGVNGITPADGYAQLHLVNGLDTISSASTQFGCVASGNVPDATGYLTPNVLISQGQYNNNPVLPFVFNTQVEQEIITPNLFASWQTSGSTTWNIYNSVSPNGEFVNSCHQPTAVNYTLQTSTVATFNRLWSVVYTIGPTTYSNNTNIIPIIGGLNVTPPTLPNSSTGINLQNTTTIAFNSLANLVTLTAGVTFPKYDILALALLLVIISAGLFETHKLGHLPFVLLIAAVWVLGFWQIQLLYLAVIVTVVFIVIEFTEYRHRSYEAAHTP